MSWLFLLFFFASRVLLLLYCSHCVLNSLRRARLQLSIVNATVKQWIKGREHRAVTVKKVSKARRDRRSRKDIVCAVPVSVCVCVGTFVWMWMCSSSPQCKLTHTTCAQQLQTRYKTIVFLPSTIQRQSDRQTDCLPCRPADMYFNNYWIITRSTKRCRCTNSSNT